jgi:hypothetical protein
VGASDPQYRPTEMVGADPLGSTHHRKISRHILTIDVHL